MIALLLLLLCVVPEARACSCIGPTLTREVLPGVGADGFPTDGRIRVLLRGGWPAELRELLGGEYRLRGPDGELVPFRTEIEGLDLALVPDEPLAANTDYVLERLFAYGDGRLVSDDTRVTLAGLSRRGNRIDPPGEVVRSWFPELAFRTGEGPEARRPTSPTVVNATWYVDNDSSCGPGEYLWASLEIPGDTLETDVIGLEIYRHGIISRVAHRQEFGNRRQVHVGDMDCTADKVHLNLFQSLRVRAVVFTAGGQTSTIGPWVRAIPAKDQEEDPEILRHHDPPRAPSSLAALQAWSAPPVVEGRALPGPASCPYGLSVVDSAVVASSEAVEGVAAKRNDEGEIRVWRTGPRGVLVWERRIREPSFDGYPTVLEGAGTVLVTWERRRTVGERRESWPTWAVLDAATGSVRGQGDLGTLGPATDAKVMGWDGSHFLLAWVGPDKSALLALVGPEGAVERAFRLPGTQLPSAFDRADGEWVVVWASAQGQQVAWLDEQGSTVAGPYRTDSAALAWATAGAVQGGLLALAGVNAENRVAVVVIDRSGASSPVLVIDGSPYSRTSGLVGTGDGFLLSRLLNSGKKDSTVVESLACRTDPPPPRAPSRLAP